MGGLTYMKISSNNNNSLFKYNNILSHSNVFEFVFIIGLVALPMLISNSYYRDWFVMAFIMAGASCAWNIIGGYAGMLSIGHAAFFGIGAYTSTLLYVRVGISPWLGLIAGALLSTIAAIVIGRATLRLKGTFFVLVTIAFCEVLRFTAIGWRSLTFGSMGITLVFKKNFFNMMWQGKTAYVLLTFGYLVFVYAFNKIIEKKKFGYYLVAIREDQDAACACGIPAAKIKTIGLMISAFLTSIGGSIYAQYVMYIEPDVVFDIMISVQLILIGILGGKGKAFGPIMGAIIIIPLSSFLRGSLANLSGLHGFVYGVALVLVIIFIPEGVYGRLYRFFNKNKKNIKNHVEGVM
jgi:branched-chain amino acid transport system permease protein